MDVFYLIYVSVGDRVLTKSSNHRGISCAGFYSSILVKKVIKLCDIYIKWGFSKPK